VIRLAIFVTAFCIVAAGEARAQTAVWIDTDPSIGAPWREVDDAFALVLAFHSQELRITGISTTYGNVGVRRTTTVARDLVRRFGGPAGINEADIYAGASTPDDVGGRSPASDALAQALRRERLTYIALGPLTNLAAFLKLHPTLANRIKRVVFVGGMSPGYTPRFGPTGALRIHDANVFKDPAAVRAILASRIPIVLAPVETSSALVINRADARQLQRGGTAGAFLHGRTRAWLWFWTSIVKHRGGVMFDSLAVLRVARPDLVAIEPRYAHVTPAGDLIASKQPLRNARRVSFCTRITPDAREVTVGRLSR
jgi:pyrimidine-specific ribonucleoside hydrolase